MAMYARGGCAIVALFSLGLATAAAAPAPAVNPLKVVWTDLAELPAAVADTARAELRSALAQAGVAVDVRTGKSGQVVPGDEVLLVVVPRPAPQRAHGRSVMGAVLRDTPAHRTAWIHLPTVLEAVGLTGSLDAKGPRDQRDAGIAIGRVAAHELVHVLVPGEAHSSSGLMAESLDRWTLTAPAARLDPRTRDALCASLDPRPALPARVAAARIGVPVGGDIDWP